MALRMVALNRASDGRWFARKGIPEDVREEYSRDDTPDYFPAFTDGPTRGTGISSWDLFEAFVKALIGAYQFNT